MVGPLLALLLLSTHALAAPIFFSTGNPGVDGAIAGAGLGLVAGEIQLDAVLSLYLSFLHV